MRAPPARLLFLRLIVFFDSFAHRLWSSQLIIPPTKRIQRFWLCSVYLSDQGTLPEVLQAWRVCLEPRSHSGITPTCIRFQSSNTVRVNVFLPHAMTTEDPPCLVRVKPIRHDYDDQRRRQERSIAEILLEGKTKEQKSCR